MKYHVGQMLKFVGPTEGQIHYGMIGVVEPADRHTRLAAIITGAVYYNMNFPGYFCSGCGGNHGVDVQESALRPIDDPDKDEEMVTDEELNEELTK